MASAPTFKRSLLFPVNYLTRRLEKLAVNVKLGTEATPESVLAAKPDVVIVATGARPLVPDIPGVRGKKVVLAWDAHRDPKAVRGDRVVVAGGGLVGCETALALAREGRKVIVIEMLPEVAADLNLVNRMALLRLLGEAGVELRTGLRIKSIREEGVATTTADGQESLTPADMVVLALGSEPDDSLLRSLRESHPRVLAAGDCVKPRKIGSAIHEGFAAGLDA